MHPDIIYFPFWAFLGRNTKTKENTNKYVFNALQNDVPNY